MNLYDHNPHIQAHLQLRDGTSVVTSKIAAYHSQRSISNPVAQATVVIYGDGSDLSGIDTSLIDVLKDYDMCTVTMLDAKGQRWRDIVGLVRGVQLGQMEQDGRPVKVTTIQLVGIGEALQFYQVFWLTVSDPSRLNAGGLGYKIRSKGTVPKGRPHQVIGHVYDTWINDTYLLKFANGKLLSQMLDLHFSDITDCLNAVGLRVMMDMASLWNAMVQMADLPFNEFFLALPEEGSPAAHGTPNGKNTVALYLRPTPFDFDRWDKLARAPGWSFSYDDSERMGAGEQLAHNNAKVYNMFWTTAQGYFSQARQQAGAYQHSGRRLPIKDDESIRRLGLRRLEVGTKYIHFIDKKSDKQGTTTATQKQLAKTHLPGLYDMLVARTQQLQRWFGYDRFIEGQIQTRGRIGNHPAHGARIGSILTRKRDDWQGYITGIAQQWQFPGPHITTLQVERFHNPVDHRAWWHEKQG